MGHEWIATTNRYLHFLGTGADVTALDKLNRGTSNGSGTVRPGRPVRSVRPD